MKTDLKKECVSCNVKRTPIFFKNKKKKNLCSVCESKERKRERDREYYYKKKGMPVKPRREGKKDEIRLSIFDEEKELRSKAKLSLDQLKELEQKKLKNGYTWKWVEVQITKTTTQKQRVLTKSK